MFRQRAFEQIEGHLCSNIGNSMVVYQSKSWQVYHFHHRSFRVQLSMAPQLHNKGEIDLTPFIAAIVAFRNVTIPYIDT